MNKFNLSLISAALLASTASYAGEQPQASELVGKFYGGIHYNLIKPDEDRLNGINADFDLSNGFGIEAGYRYSENMEFRLSYTDFTIEFENSSADMDGDALSLDLLYFPSLKHNYYLLAGANNLDIGETELAANLGLGYRHYFSERFAAYAEAKVHYQFDDSYIDQSAQLGLIYFFGEVKKSAPAKKVEQPVVAPAPTPVSKPAEKPAPMVKQPVDSDKDGVYDEQDQCANTPMSDKVDAQGCTIFTEQTLTQTLLINFDNNKADIKTEYESEVARIAKFLSQYPHTNITIEGHTSKLGSAGYNQTLSQKRADAVVNMLVTKYAIDASRLTAKGYGESRLIDTDNTAQAHAINRRIEAKVSVTEKVSVQK